MMQSSRELVQWLIEQDVQTVKAWLDEVWEGTRNIPEGFDWPNFAAALAVLARAGKGPPYYVKPDLEWGRVTIAVYQYAMTLIDPLSRFSLEITMMYLKGHLIVHYGNIVGDPVLDANLILEWFFQNLHLSPEEALKQAANANRLESEERLLLSYIKERLSLLRFLLKVKVLESNEELNKWLAIREQLPLIVCKQRPLTENRRLSPSKILGFILSC